MLTLADIGADTSSVNKAASVSKRCFDELVFAGRLKVRLSADCYCRLLRFYFCLKFLSVCASDDFRLADFLSSIDLGLSSD